MPPGATGSYRVVLFALLIVSLFSLSACQLTGDTPAQNDDSRKLKEDVSKLQKELATREVEFMQLRLQLLQKDEEIGRLASSQEQAVQDVVRAKARLRSHAGKAETVANMAEVRMMLTSSKEKAASVSHRQMLKRADQYLTMGDAELDVENYEGAAYLVGKARELVRPTGSGNGVVNISAAETEARFYNPISMQTLSRSNVREKANIKARILFRIDAEIQVRAIAYKGPWLKIQTAENKTGWIYYKLVEVVR